MAESIDVKDMNKKPKVSKKPPFNWKVVLVIVVLVLALGAAFYFWNEANNAKDATPEAVAAKNQEESDRVINSLSLVLYTDSEDQPTVARIEDPEVLKAANEDFYKNAQTGDYLVLYPNRAIIYRESENLVVNVAPIINTDDITPSK
jgi:uncharacterized protein HemX